MCWQSRARSNLLLKYSAFAYLVPGVIVAIAAGGWPSGYGRADICWLSTTGHQLIFAFAGPVAFVMLVNIIFFVRVLSVVTGMSRRRRSLEQPDKLQSLKRALVASGSFFSVMGLGWVFGLLTLENNILAFQYLFAIFGGLQGFFIFYFHVWRDSAVWNAFGASYYSSGSTTTDERCVASDTSMMNDYISFSHIFVLYCVFP